MLRPERPMDAIRARLLSRFLDAADAMADAASTPAGPRETDETRPDDCRPSRRGTQQGPAADVHAAAMEALLKRQAALMGRIHRTHGKGQTHGINEDLVARRLDDVATAATASFYAYRFDCVPLCWRCLYTEAKVLSTHLCLIRAFRVYGGRLDDDALDRVVATLDKALITTGGAMRRPAPSWIETTLQMLEELWLVCERQRQDALTDEPSPKRQKTSRRDSGPPAHSPPDNTFSTDEPHGRPTMSSDRQCPRHGGWSLAQFEAYMAQDRGNPRPVVFTDLMDGWPALTDRPWNRPAYLLSRTFGGRRLVPVEIGRSYVDEGWGQELIPFGQFLARYVDPRLRHTGHGHGGEAVAEPSPVGYLAQHNLFSQIPGLRSDTAIPDFCWAAVPPHPTSPSKDQPRLETPRLNAWFGPAGTITPLHTDSYHNLLCQVVGTKYVRLYPPSAAPDMQPRAPELGVDMSNTSAIDLGVVEGWDPPASGPDADADEGRLRKLRARLGDLEYWECVLRPGETLLIPIGWWHYVRSLSISFSISFWWN